MKRQKNKLQQIFQELREFIKECEESKTEATFQPTHIFLLKDLGGLMLDLELGRKYSRILDMLSPDEGSPQTISRAQVDSLLQECMLTCLDIHKKQTDQSLDQRIDAAINSLQEKLQSPLVDWEVWQPVARLKVGVEGFSFGKAFFCNEDHKLASEAKNKVCSFLRSSQQFKRESDIAVLWPEEISKLVLCRFVVKAVDLEAAQQIAAFELETTLSVLDFFASIYSFPSVCIPGKLPSSNTWTLALKEKSRPSFSIKVKSEKSEAVIYLIHLQNNESIKKAMKKADAMLREEGENKYRERFLTAMKWAGKAALAERREDAFLFCMIALEALLLGSSHDVQLSYRLRLRAAHLLGLNQAERTTVRDQINKLYEMRSKIVHTGKIQIPASDLLWLFNLTRNAIIRLLTDEQFDVINTDKSLEEWFENALLCGSNLTT